MDVILVDDEQLALDFMEHNLNQIGNIKIKGKYLNPLVAKEAILKESVDAVFLDINLPEITGLELAEILLESKPHLMVIFITAYDEHALEAFELNALDYIVKPVTIDRLKITIERLESLLDYQASRPTSRQKELKIKVSQQLLIENQAGKFEKVSWRTARAQEIFLFLLQNQGLFVSKDMLIEMFWPDFESERAFSQLYSTIYQIRKKLAEYGDHFEIKNMTDGYLFSTQDVQVDLVEWEKRIKQVPPIDAKTINQHVAAMKWYAGAYLADHPYLWAGGERYRLEQLWIDSALNIADWYYEQGQFREAEQFYRDILATCPETEDAGFNLMKIYAQLGNQVGVYRVYEQLEETLKDKLDLPPRAEISDWFQAWHQKL